MSIQYLIVGLFGALGSASRFWLEQYIRTSSSETSWLNPNLPYGTLTVNVLGSFLAGYIAGYLSSRGYILGSSTHRSGLELALILGFCGGFTTFSAFSLQLADLIQRNDYKTLFIYILISPALGLLAAIAGLKISS